jgi:hypothetical protein
MNASLPQRVPPITKHVVVADERGALAITLFPRRIVPPAIWTSFLLYFVVAFVLLRLGSNRVSDIVMFAAAATAASLVGTYAPYRLHFRLDARGLVYVGAPKAKVHRLELPLDAIESIRSVRQGEHVHLAVFEVGGRVTLISCWRMGREDADAIAFALRRRLEELRESRETFRA